MKPRVDLLRSRTAACAHDPLALREGQRVPIVGAGRAGEKLAALHAAIQDCDEAAMRASLATLLPDWKDDPADPDERQSGAAAGVPEVLYG